MAHLHRLHKRKYGGDADVADLEEFFGQILETYGAGWSVFGARKDGRWIAFSSLLSRPGAHKTFMYAAVPDACDPRANLYGNLGIYVLIKRAIELGGGSLSTGPTNYPAKLMRGFRLLPLHGLYKPLAIDPDVLRATCRALHEVQLALLRSVTPDG
jgi:hypothetical protein